MKDLEEIELKIDQLAKSGNMKKLDSILESIIESYVKERVKNEG